MFGLQHVVLDTNVVATDRHMEFFSSTCVRLLQDYDAGSELKVAWIVPRIVRLERAQQMLLRFRDSIKIIKSAMFVFEQNAELDDDSLSRAVEKHIDLMLRTHRVDDIDLDPSLVDWRSLINDAAARRSVFEVGDTEKGFKDRVFLETVRQIYASGSWNDERVLWVVTGDKRLGEELASLGVRVLSSIDELRSSLNGTRQHIGRIKLGRLIMNAAEEFKRTGDSDDVWTRAGLAQRIRGEFPEPFQPPPGWGPLWQTDESWGLPVFVKEEGDVAHFSTTYSATPLFLKRVDADESGELPPLPPGAALVTSPSLLSLVALHGLEMPGPEERGYYAAVMKQAYAWHINWSAKVGPELELSDIQVIDIEPAYTPSPWHSALTAFKSQKWLDVPFRREDTDHAVVNSWLRAFKSRADKKT